LQTENRIYKTDNDFTQWRKELQKKDGLVLKINNQVFEIKDGLLAKNSEILDKEEAWKSWKFLYKNKDQIKIIEDRQQFEAEQEENRKEQLKKELLKTYFGKKYEYYTKNALGGDELLYYEILKIEDIIFKDDGSIDKVIFIGKGEDGLNYRLEATLNQLKLYTK
jgi:hypothetical protein